MVDLCWTTLRFIIHARLVQLERGMGSIESGGNWTNGCNSNHEGFLRLGKIFVTFHGCYHSGFVELASFFLLNVLEIKSLFSPANININMFAWESVVSLRISIAKLQIKTMYGSVSMHFVLHRNFQLTRTQNMFPVASL